MTNPTNNSSSCCSTSSSNSRISFCCKGISSSLTEWQSWRVWQQCV